MISDEARRRGRRVLTVALGVLLALSLAGVVYVAVDPPTSNVPYTEFYILGPSGNASEYPSNLSVGERGELLVGLENHEGEQANYTVALVTDGSVLATEAMTLENEETGEKRVAFRLDSPGEHRLDVLLFRGNEVRELERPLDALRLTVSVHE